MSGLRKHVSVIWGVRALFTRDQRWQRYLDVEAALALAEASLGVVPVEAAAAIAAAARLQTLDTERIEAGGVGRGGRAG